MLSENPRAFRWPRGELKRRILLALGDETLNAWEVQSRCPQLPLNVVRRTLSIQCIEGALRNVGTRQRARYARIDSHEG